jgi:hypothetical protein
MRALLVAALIGLAAALSAPTAANAATCWQRVLDDWRDGRLDAVYPVHCYRDALRNMPEDLRVYGTADSDIQSALARALARTAINHPRRTTRVAARTTVTTTTTAPPPASPATPDRTRTLAGHATTQPKLRLVAAAKQHTGDSGFPLGAIVVGAAALGAALVIVAALHRYPSRRLRP